MRFCTCRVASMLSGWVDIGIVSMINSHLCEIYDVGSVSSVVCIPLITKQTRKSSMMLTGFSDSLSSSKGCCHAVLNSRSPSFKKQKVRGISRVFVVELTFLVWDSDWLLLVWDMLIAAKSADLCDWLSLEVHCDSMILLVRLDEGIGVAILTPRKGANKARTMIKT